MKRSLWMFSLALIMSTTAVVFAADSPFPSRRLGGCNTVCARDSNCTDPQCPFCEPFVTPGAKGSALCRSF
jgi:hypothetical protein